MQFKSIKKNSKTCHELCLHVANLSDADLKSAAIRSTRVCQWKIQTTERYSDLAIHPQVFFLRWRVLRIPMHSFELLRL